MRFKSVISNSNVNNILTSDSYFLTYCLKYVYCLIRIFILIEMRYYKTKSLLLIIGLLSLYNVLIKRLTNVYSIRRKKFNSDIIKSIFFINSKIYLYLMNWKIVNKKKDFPINYSIVELNQLFRKDNVCHLRLLIIPLNKIKILDINFSKTVRFFEFVNELNKQLVRSIYVTVQISSYTTLYSFIVNKRFRR